PNRVPPARPARHERSSKVSASWARLWPVCSGVAFILPRVVAVRSRPLPLSPLLLTVPDTARRLRRHEQTVRAMIRRGDLAAIRLGRLVRVLATAVDRASAMTETTVHRPTPRRALRRLTERARA